MTVDISNDELQQFQDNGITQDDIKNTVDYYRNEGLSDEEIRAKVDTKLKSFNPQKNADMPQDSLEGNGSEEQPFQVGVSKNVDLRPSALADNLAKHIVALPIAGYNALKNKSFKGAYSSALNDLDKAKQKMYELDPLQKKIDNAGNATLDIGATFMLPEIKAFQGAGLGAKIGNSVLTNAYQGGLIGGVEDLRQGGNGFGGATIGALGGGALGTAMPLTGAVISKLLPRAGASIAGVSTDTIRQAIKPNSRALDLNSDQAQSLLLDTTQNVRNAYNNLLSKRGQAVNDAIDNLRGNEYRVPLEDLKSDIKSTFDQYGGELINPARNMTGGLERNLNELVSGGTSDPRATLGLDNNFITNNIDPLTRNINEAELSYRQLLNNVFNNANDQNIYAKAGDDLYNIVKNLPEDVQGSFYERLGNDLDTIYNKTQTISPIDLQKAKQQIGHMVNWSDETARNYQNPILEQIYNKYNRRLSDLSPELEKANRQFANLRGFQKNEGLNRILKAGNNIDSASSALKNYNSTVTKGNTGRNIKDLENILVANGSEPFLNTVDDINAAMDLNKSITTGRNFGGVTDLAKSLLIEPTLRGVRAINKAGFVENLNNLRDNVNPSIIQLLYGVTRPFSE